MREIQGYQGFVQTEMKVMKKVMPGLKISWVYIPVRRKVPD